MGLEEFLLQRAERQGEKRGERKGEKKGIEKTKKLFIQNLLTKTNHSDELIADLADVDVSLVSKLRHKLKS